MAMPGSTTCQVSRDFQSRETMFTMLRTSSASLFQSFAKGSRTRFATSSLGPCRSLLISTGARPFARKSKAKLVASTRFRSIMLPSQNPEN